LSSRQLVVLLLAVIIAFGGCLWGSFHFDDYSLFSGSLWRPFDVRPLTYLTFWLNDEWGGRNPVGYHAVNLLLHVFAAVLLWTTLQCVMPSKPAWIAALVFAVHPFQAEPVNYIFARSTLLDTLLSIASLFCWLRGRRWWAVVWFGVALLAKEECVALPVFIVLLEIALASRQRDKLKLRLRAAAAPIAAMFALSLAAGIRVFLAAAALPGSGAGPQAAVSWQSYLLAQGIVILRYLRMFVLPWGFSVDPEVAVPGVAIGTLAWLGVALLAAVACLRLRRDQPGFWFLGGLVLLLPSSSIFPATDLAADRRMYLPMIGFAAAAALLVEKVRPALLASALILLLGLSTLRTETWRNEQSLWSDAVRKAPEKVRPRIQLARASNPERALQLLYEASQIAPDDPAIPAEQGRVYLGMGRPDLALPAFGRVLALTPRSAEAFNNRGAAFLALGQKQAAREDFERALAIDHCQFDARLNLKRMGVAQPLAAGCRYSREQAQALEGN